MTRAAAYLRCSTLPQLQQFGPEVQRTSITKYAAQHGITITDWYEDAITGKTAKRDALNQLLDHAPRYEAVILSSVDRLARRVPIAYGVLGELVDTGLAVHSTDMGVIDLDDDSSSVQFGIRTLFADQDHRRITRRLHAARVAKVASGKAYWDLNGYGWRKGAADEVEQHWARWMYQRVQQVGVTTIANELAERGVTTRHGNPWTAHRVAAYLRNPTNKGVFQFGRRSGRILAAAPCPAIVDEDTWNRAQDALTSRRINRARYGSRTHLYPLNGRVICGECGKAMGGRTENGKNHYYRCSNAYQYDGRRTCNHRRYWNTTDLHAGILTALADAAAHPDTLADLLRPIAPPPVDLAPLLADVDRRLARLDAAYEAGAYDVQEYVYKRQQLKQERDTLAATPTTPPPPPDTLSAAAALRDALDDVSDLHRVAEQTRLRAVIHADGQVEVTVDP